MTSLVDAFRRYRLLSRGTTVNGKVTATEIVSTSGTGAARKRAHIEFTYANRLVHLWIEYSAANYCRGDSVSILVDPSDPERSQVRSFFALWGGVLAGALFGGLFVYLGFQKM